MGGRHQPVKHDERECARPTADRDATADRSTASAAAQLAAVRATQLLAAAAEESFDRLTRIAQRVTGAPLAFMTVVDGVRSFWLSSQGLAPGSPTQNTVAESFCQYVLGGEPLVLADVTVDERTAATPRPSRPWACGPGPAGTRSQRPAFRSGLAGVAVLESRQARRRLRSVQVAWAVGSARGWSHGCRHRRCRRPRSGG
ncbi:hypothetical protein SAMN05660642_01699 [Geodermatophilus siccatus]|uniref:GAF domain-containing protein n=1 Tax=Geodermatophilus siccatus TaxID=1137991 RepID=A0A1G9QJB2_9ACTN|nr:hypothetical protein SAMN05660642_01699 [Geodermatophilus siccatus]